MSLETKVGAFVLGGLLFVATAIFLLGDVTFEKRYALYVSFSDVANLTKDSPVKLSGVEVGQVKNIELQDSRARVVCSIRKGVEIFKDAEFTIGSTGIIGSKYLQIDQGRRAAGVIEPETTVPGTDPVSIEKSLAKTLNSMQKMMDDMNTDGPRGSLTKNLKETVANVRDMTASLNDLIESSRPRMEKALERTDDITAKLDSLLAKSNLMMASLTSSTGTIGALLHDEQMKKDVKETIASVRETAGTAKDVFGRINQFRVFWNYDWRYEHAIRTSQVDIGLKISPRPGRYYYVGGSNLVNLNDQQRGTNYNQPNRIDALIGFEKGPWDWGVGVIRSGGGGRVTYTPYKDDKERKLSLVAQGYDFGRNRIIEGRRFDHPAWDFGILAKVHRLFGIGARIEDVQETKRYQTWVNVAFEDTDIAYLFGMVSFGAAGSKGRSKSQ